MIIEIKLANYRSIHAEQTLSFVAERGPRHPQNLIKRPGYRLLKAAALFGANASGKSNFVRAIGEMRDFVRDSATKMNDGDPIVCAQPFRLDPESRDAPSRFEITFVTEGVQYVYGFTATRERVHEEWLTAKPEKGGKETFGFKRSYDAKMQTYSCISNEPKGVMAELILNRTRDNALVLSTGAQQNVKELLSTYRYIRGNIKFYDVSTGANELAALALTLCQRNKQLFALAVALVRDADVGISTMDMNLVPLIASISITPDMSTEIQTIFEAIRNMAEGVSAPMIDTYRNDNVGVPVTFNFSKDESFGTQRFFAVAVIFLDALAQGLFLAIDELDASMHPLLTRRLLEMFQSEQANPNGAQLLFTTHDAVLLDSALFRRDQIILAEKCDNESRFYSLADVVPPPRNTEMFLRNYLTGRFGGTPHLGPAFEMLALESKA